MKRLLLCSTLLTSLVACGGGSSGGDVDPTLIPGGGIADPGLDGEANVYVIDEDTDAPIEGATVYVGSISGPTDASGLFVATGVSGPQTITAVAAGHVPSTWVGVDGANVTIPLGSTAATTAIAQGTVTGTVAGWSTMTAPTGTALVALASYSWNDDDDDPANRIQQPTGDPAPNTCVKLPLSTTPCLWSVLTRTGRMAMFAYIGNADTSQNVEITGFAYRGNVQVSDGQTVDGVTLEVAAAGDLVAPDLTLPSAPTGTDTVEALIRMDLGADGRLLVPQTSALPLPVPKTSLFPGATYDLIGVAQTSAGAAGPQSLRLARGLDSVATASLSTFLALPTAIETDGTTFSFAAVAAATIHTFTVRDTSGDDAWAVAIFDDSVSVTRPDAITLPQGTLTFRVQAIEIPDLDVRDFVLDDVAATVTASAVDDVTFSN